MSVKKELSLLEQQVLLNLVQETLDRVTCKEDRSVMIIIRRILDLTGKYLHEYPKQALMYEIEILADSGEIASETAGLVCVEVLDLVEYCLEGFSNREQVSLQVRSLVRKVIGTGRPCSQPISTPEERLAESLDEFFKNNRESFSLSNSFLKDGIITQMFRQNGGRFSLCEGNHCSLTNDHYTITYRFGTGMEIATMCDKKQVTHVHGASGVSSLKRLLEFLGFRQMVMF